MVGQAPGARAVGTLDQDGVAVAEQGVDLGDGGRGIIETDDLDPSRPGRLECLLGGADADEHSGSRLGRELAGARVIGRRGLPQLKHLGNHDDATSVPGQSRQHRQRRRHGVDVGVVGVVDKEKITTEFRNIHPVGALDAH